ncbi:RagB/SusD family nutrient uptake outer membrane protein [Chitinophaga pendula]|uniref:RagB/SusD family nutrient uptake outer membrane protein n=1 Tax=Chitinophaga TaxID=79328 RepID=UPI000BAEAB7E|nr:MULTISPECIES: RagB/SusD family nutrient uptake outer membrane protein [Chitinophaga]ASZ14964.1 RagB/SusD family nutrient uptake outer membrane protein [Chitinophaga sp. MD30]UCJ10131.1 RagB/SusD family nutrient uptake outer membrane protein [Chitinophaga pendula]
MKKTSIIYLVGWCLLAGSACKRDQFLNLTPEDALSDPTYFKNETDLKLYCNSFYGTLPVMDAGSDNNSDNMVPRDKDRFLSGQYIVPIVKDDNNNEWSWKDERNVNFFLQRYERAAASAAIKEKYAAEARFFRALYFWQKVKRYGDVPWFSADLNEKSPELYLPRTARKAVMDSVLKDLNYAVDKLPLPGSAERGRLHKYAAAALKARICLWEGTYRRYHQSGDDVMMLNEAASAAALIIGSGQYDIWSTGHPLTDYYNLFIQDELQGNKEAILPKRFLKDVFMHNLTRQLGENNTGFSKNFVRSFLCTDGLPAALSPLYKGDDSLNAERANRDPRFTQLIATSGFVFQVNANGVSDIITLPRIGTSVTSTGYQRVKGRSPSLVEWNANQSVLDLFIFRYAEVLLVYAEAKAELGACDQDVLDRTINKLRSRVGMTPMRIATLVKDPQSDFPDLDVLLDEIRRERRIELAAEGFRFDDLLRWNAGSQTAKPEAILGMKLLPAIKAQYPNQNQVKDIVVDANGYIRVYTDITSRTWNNKFNLYPIPVEELTLNPKLQPQNPGW